MHNFGEIKLRSLVENCFQDECDISIMIVELISDHLEMTLKGVLNTLIEYETPRYVKVTNSILHNHGIYEDDNDTKQVEVMTNNIRLAKLISLCSQVLSKLN